VIPVTSGTLEAPASPRSSTLDRADTALRLVSFPSILATNPYQRLLYGELARHGIEAEDAVSEFRLRWLWSHRHRVDLLHFHWPHGFWRPSGRRWVTGRVVDWAYVGVFTTRLVAARLLGFRIAWTIHQVYAHDRQPNRLDRAGARCLARASHLLLAHDAATARHAQEQLGRSAREVRVVPHGSYTGVYPPGRGRAEVRRELGIGADHFVFLHLGDMRAYKDLARLLAAFRDADLPDAILVVAGTPGDEESETAVREAAAADSRIVLRLAFVPDDAVSELYEAADAAVVARSDGGTSGSLILALSMGKAVVAADRPAYRALVGVDAAGWLFAPGDSASLSAALERARSTQSADRAAKCRAALARAEALDWTEIGRRTAELLLRATRRRTS
jgi:beta-1,4-mannosyltransferase